MKSSFGTCGKPRGTQKDQKNQKMKLLKTIASVDRRKKTEESSGSERRKKCYVQED